MKTLTPTQYQSLPVNEQCNWKEQYLDLLTDENEWFDIDALFFTKHWTTVNEIPTRYIPINPESILNAEMGSITKISDINPVHVEAMLKYPVPFTPERISFIKGTEFGYSQGKKDHNKEVIDIVYDEISSCNKQINTDLEQTEIIVNTLTSLLTKLKEII